MSEFCNDTTNLCVVGIDNIILNVASGSENVEPGDTVTVTLEVANLSEAINGLQVLLHYDDTILTLIDIVPTDLGLVLPDESGPAGPARVGFQELGQTEVQDLHVALGGHHDVVRLQVPVNDTLLMRRAHRLQQGHCDLEDLADAHSPGASVDVDGRWPWTACVRHVGSQEQAA